MTPAYAPYQPANQNSMVLVETADNRQTTNSESVGRGAIETEVSQDRKGITLAPVSRSRVLLTLNQLSVMTQNGIEIAEALQSVSNSCQDPRLARTLEDIHGAVTSGQSLSSAMTMYGKYFPSTLAPMLAAAEATGEVPETLRLICKRMRSELQMRGTIVGAMIYPLILIAASSVVMSALILGVLPQFSNVFESMGRPVPVYTQMLLSFGDFCRSHWGIILISVSGTVGSLVAFRNHSMIQKPINRFLMYGPLIRGAYRPLQAGRVLRTVAGMVHGGVPLLEAVRLTHRTTKDIYWRSLLVDVESSLIDGRTASVAMQGADFLPPETTQLMTTAERAGRVAEVLEDVGTYYEEEAQRNIKRLVVALEPAIIVVMGVIVAGIVMSVMLPLLDVSTVSPGR